MVIDSSIAVAILLCEPGYEAYVRAIRLDTLKLMSVASILECTIVLNRKPGAYEAALDQMLRALSIYPVTVSGEQLALARVAFRQFGRDNHPAALNFGDCFSYALAKVSGEPLLFKGNDFSQTDNSCY